MISLKSRINAGTSGVFSEKRLTYAPPSITEITFLVPSMVIFSCAYVFESVGDILFENLNEIDHFLIISLFVLSILISVADRIRFITTGTSFNFSFVCGWLVVAAEIINYTRDGNSIISILVLVGASVLASATSTAIVATFFYYLCAGLLVTNHFVFEFYHIEVLYISLCVLSLTSGTIFLMILERERKFKELTNLAFTDSLTGIKNRRYLYQYVQGMKESDFPAGLIIVDIDYLKIINDELGHSAGDNLILRAVKAMTDTVKNDTHVTRLGGDEFCIVVPSADLDTVAKTVTNVLHAFRHANPSISGSFGASFVEEREPISNWLRKADKALYEAKTRGRNRAVILDYEDSYV